MASAGIIPGMITCVFSGSVAAFGLYLLSRCATYTSHRRSSFFAVAKLTFPKAAVFFDAAIATKCFGVSIRYAHLLHLSAGGDLFFSYLIIIKSLMPNVVSSIFHDLTSPDTQPPAWAISGRVWISLFMVILIPLCFLRRLDSLRHTSYIALFSVGTLCLPDIMARLIFAFLFSSIPCFDCYSLLLRETGWDYRTWGNSPSTFHTKFHLDIPSPGVRFHLLSKREDHQYSIFSFRHKESL